VAPVFIDGEKAATLRGDDLTAEFLTLIDKYVSEKYKTHGS
jgi:(E)-4-hydroxy-3-methylbut-2-enyl-diphosphate synthase